MEKHRKAKWEVREERKLVKIDRQQCIANEKRGLLTMRYTVPTPKGALSVWAPIAPGQTPDQIAAELDKEHKGTGTWKVVS